MSAEMSTVYILLLTIRFQFVEAVEIPFPDEQSCVAAGQAWVNSVVATQGWYGGDNRFVCVPNKIGGG